jgi:hypothetical protein
VSQYFRGEVVSNSKDRSCAGSCEPGSRNRTNECIFGAEKPLGVEILERGVNEQEKGNGEFSSQAIGDRGGRILSQLGGFQVSGRGSDKGNKGSKGNEQRETGKARGMRHVYTICIHVHNECLNG